MMWNVCQGERLPWWEWAKDKPSQYLRRGTANWLVLSAFESTYIWFCPLLYTSLRHQEHDWGLVIKAEHCLLGAVCLSTILFSSSNNTNAQNVVVFSLVSSSLIVSQIKAYIWPILHWLLFCVFLIHHTERQRKWADTQQNIGVWLQTWFNWKPIFYSLWFECRMVFWHKH